MTLLRLILVVLCLAVSADALSRDVDTIEFFKRPEFTEVGLSPKGDYLAITVPQEDRTELAVLRVSDRRIMSKWDYGARMHPYEVQWVSDDRFMVKVAEKTNWFDGYVLTEYRVFFANADGGRRFAVEHGATYTVLSTLPEDPRHILVQRSIDSPHVFRMGVARGNLTRVAVSPMDNGGFAIDADGQVRYAIGQDRSRKHTQVHRRVDDGWQLVSEFDAFGRGDYPVGFAEDGVHVYMRGESEQGLDSLYLLNPETGERTDVFAHDQVDFDGLVYSADRRTLLGVRVEPGKPEIHYLQPDHPEVRIRAGLEQAFPGHAVWISSQSLDGRLMLARVYSDTSPGKVYLVDTQTGQATFLLSNRDWIDPEKMSPMQPIALMSRDGKPLHGYITIPRGSDGRNLPLIVNPHGGPHGVRDRWGFNPEVQFLANRGYAVLQVNFRGSGGYGSEFLSSGYRNWGTTMQDDLTDAVNWAVAQGVADPDRVCIYGASYGGYAALMSPIRAPGLYQCAIGYVGVYSLPMLMTRGDIPQTDSGRAYLARIMPETDEARQAQSPAYLVDRLDIPVMLVHGTRDQRVPQAQMDFLIRHMAAAGKAPEEVHVERRSAHGIYNPEANVAMYDTMIRFLDRHIGESRQGAVAQSETTPE
ncbi:S9 family peptidase [Alkalisalibacterium limincola]|uniref:S9 family peptidase n=1 Tax=Alkalisalibacterium limincola TaxID=2699169 RepID=A0A5C8KWE5_9GAMM|nr:S9 family peptidase [Alkalisalibacterium limincola]TXK64419.1 S9 family peptidase [Alkalisalibacterium limincola]